MKQVRPFANENLDDLCFFCSAAEPETKDHVPPKVFLDRPYPDNLGVVGSCTPCNGGASMDEEYVACLLEVAACGSVRVADLERPRIIELLTRKPTLAARLADAVRGGELVPETDRVVRVLRKVGCALWRYETGELAAEVAAVTFAPLATLGQEQLEGFLRVAPPDVLPEVGSRLLVKTLVGDGVVLVPAWQEVQSERFRYAVETAGSGRVKMILRGYLAAEIVFAYP